MGIVRDLYMARKIGAGLKLPAPTVASLIKRITLAKILYSSAEKTETGVLIHIEDALAEPALSVVVNIAPVQNLNGYSKPWPAGGGVNLFNKDDYTYINDCYIGTSTLSYGSGRVIVYIPCSPITNYTVSRKRTSSNERFSIGYTKELPAIGVSVYGIRTAATSGTVGAKMSLTTTTDADALYLVAWAWWGASDVDEAKNSMQIEVGSSATTYSPYSNICPISGITGLSVYVSPTNDVDDATAYAEDWTSPAGTVYGGSLNVVTGVLTVDRAMDTINSDSALTINGIIADVSTEVKYVPSAGKANGSDNILSDRFAISSDTQYGNVWGRPTSENVFFRLPATITTASEAKSWFGENPAQLVYELATPVTHQLTAQEVQMLLGENYIWASTGDRMRVKYKADGNATPLESLNLMLDNKYSNPGTAEDVSDIEALNILLGR